MKYFILTFGCQMNISDSQRIATKLEELGYKSAPESEADLVVLNSCSVRQHAVDRIWGKIRNWQKEGKEIIISGCVLAADKKKFQDKNIAVLNIKDLNNINKILNKNSISNTCENIDYLKITPKMAGQIAFVTIMTGCDNFCSYCAVPYTRGREISRPMKDIVDEVQDAIKSGYREILLLGQNVNSYGIKSEIRNSKSKTNSKLQNPNNEKFIDLLKSIDNLPGDFRFNFMSSNPHDMGDDLIECFASLKKWPREIHLAMQSGDDEILKKMNRKYTSLQFLELVNNLKLKIKNLKLSTDIIVGFPGETKQQFENTYKLSKKIGFVRAYIAQYSPRNSTLSAKLKDNVEKKEKKRRWEKLNKFINK